MPTYIANAGLPNVAIYVMYHKEEDGEWINRRVQYTAEVLSDYFNEQKEIQLYQGDHPPYDGSGEFPQPTLSYHIKEDVPWAPDGSNITISVRFVWKGDSKETFDTFVKKIRDMLQS
jgi:hypothetical protein